MALGYVDGRPGRQAISETLEAKATARTGGGTFLLHLGGGRMDGRRRLGHIGDKNKRALGRLRALGQSAGPLPLVGSCGGLGTPPPHLND